MVLADGTILIAGSITLFNIHILDGDPIRGDCASDYPPKENHHNLVNVAAHEIGHTLVFDHNQLDTVSLMWSDVNSYFVCGTIAPTPDETNVLPIVYTSGPCQ